MQVENNFLEERKKQNKKNLNKFIEKNKKQYAFFLQDFFICFCFAFLYASNAFGKSILFFFYCYFATKPNLPPFKKRQMGRWGLIFSK